MKKIILLLFAASTVTANAQSLKDALFGGKLKNDSGSVVRKGDDLSTKIDTAKKKPADADKVKITSIVKDSSATVVVTQKDAATNVTVADNNNTPATNAAGVNNVPANNTVNSAPRDNNKIWKEYMD